MFHTLLFHNRVWKIKISRKPNLKDTSSPPLTHQHSHLMACEIKTLPGGWIFVHNLSHAYTKHQNTRSSKIFMDIVALSCWVRAPITSSFRSVWVTQITTLLRTRPQSITNLLDYCRMDLSNAIWNVLLVNTMRRWCRSTNFILPPQEKNLKHRVTCRETHITLLQFSDLRVSLFRHLDVIVLQVLRSS